MKMPLERQGTAVKVFKGTCHTFLGFATSKGRALALANKINHSAIRVKTLHFNPKNLKEN